MAETATIPAPARPDPFARILLGVCVAAGGIIAYVFGNEPFVTVVALAAVLAALASQAILGMVGFVTMSLVLCAFFLMKRIDEAVVLDLGAISLECMYLLALGVAVFLALYTGIFRAYMPALPRKALAPLQRMSGLYGFFLMAALIGLVWNRVFLPDPAVPARRAIAELAAIGIVVLPIVNALVLPHSNLNRVRALWCLRAFVALGGLSGFIMAVFGLLPAGIVDRLGWSETTGGTLDLVRGRLPLGHANSVAAVMMLIVPSALVQGLRAERWHWRLLGLGATVMMFCGVLFSLSRSALLCLMLAMALAFLYHIRVSTRRQRWWAFAALGLAGLAMAGVAAYLFATYDFSRFWSRRYYEEASTERRLSSLKTGLAVWSYHPVFGVAPDAVFPRLELRPGWVPPRADAISPIFIYRGHVSAENPHNAYVSVLAEFGLVGFVLYFLPLAIAVRFLWRARPPAAEDPVLRDILAGAAISVCSFLTMGFFEAVLMTGIRVNLVFWVFLGISLRIAVLATKARAQDTDARPPLHA